MSHVPTLLSYAFRPFFLLAGTFAVLAMAQWLLVIDGQPWPAAGSFSTVWHGHEMAVGFGGAVVAGFLLTAVATWTSRPPITGIPLAMLATTWLAGRLAMLFAGLLPAATVAVADLSFPVLLALLATREIIGGRSSRNYGVLALAWLLVLLDLLYQAAATGLLPAGSDAETEQVIVRLNVHLLAVLVATIGGRVIPSFTGNWLRERGDVRLPRIRPWLERAVIPLTVAAGVGQAAFPDATLTAMLCLAAGVGHCTRLAGWRGWRTTAEPLLFILHAAYAWLAFSYLLLGAVALGLPLPGTAALHALTIGGIGGMILGMMTRVALGHTGRRLRAAGSIVLAYLLLGLAAAIRTFGPAIESLGAIAYRGSGLLWVASFGLFLWHYGPILSRPRVDQPGTRTAAT